MSDIYSFYKLISEYKVVIPVVQRSYAEGRNTKQAEDVRKSLVASLITASTQKQPLFFDFVYGNILASDKEMQFIPFDGQQRLTTLFLFYRYVFEKAGEPLDLLKHFTYQTRPSSKEFCEKLCDNRIIPEDDANLSENVCNQRWFFSDWKKDPTIFSMLTVLDEIHAQFKNKDSLDYKEIANQLKNYDIIALTTGSFVNMKDNVLPASTYVKMNARGRNLTPFENFKASLEEYLEKSDKLLCETLKDNIDGKWLDLFYEQANRKLPDPLIMSFINRHFINVWNLSKKSDDFNKDLFESVGKNLVSFPEIDTFIAWSVYETVLKTCSVKKCIQPIFNFLEVFFNDKESIQNTSCGYHNWKLFSGIKTPNRMDSETYPSRVAFYALISYFAQSDFDEESFSNWERAIWNVIENQTIDAADTYVSALRLVDELSLHSHDIYTFLANPNEIKSDFANEQIEEERLKAKKILESKSWESKILEAEKYEILLGKIMMLFQNRENTTAEEFNERYNLLKVLYENEDDYRIVKVLISYYKKDFPDGRINLGCTLGESKSKNVANIKQLVTKTFAHEFRQVHSDSICKNISQPWVEELTTTNLLNISRGKYLKRYGNRVVLWGTQGCIWTTFGNNVWGNVILGETARNTLLKSLDIPKSDFETDYGNEDAFFFSGWETYFKFKKHYFCWWTHDSKKECDVYLMTDNWEDWAEREKSLTPKTETEADDYFAFSITDDMLKDTSLFKRKLEELISDSKN